MSRIFVSYRRDDSSGHAGRLQERFRRELGNKSVFVDVESIEPGVNFAEAIKKAIAGAKVMIAVIGKDWLVAEGPQVRRRLDDPNDYVRLELEHAFQRKIKVIPVLVRGATMPRAEELPTSLQKLSETQAFELRDTRWDADMAALLRKAAGPLPLRIIRRNKWSSALFLGLAPIFIAVIFFLTQGPVDSAERFLTLLAQGKMQQAYLSTAFTTQQQMDEQTFVREMRRMGLHDNASVSWSSRGISNGRAQLSGTITTKQRTVIPVTIVLIEEADEWKVATIQLHTEVKPRTY